MFEIYKNSIYSKITLVIYGIIGISILIFYGQNVFVPLVMALLFSVLLQPLVVFFCKKLKFPKLLSILVTLTIFILSGIGLFYFIYLQVNDMVNDIDTIKSHLLAHYSNLQGKLGVYLNLSQIEQDQIISDIFANVADDGKQIFGNIISSFSDSIINLLVIPVYTFLFLFYKDHLKIFLVKLFRNKQQKKLREVLDMIKVSIQSYVFGLLIEMVGVTILSAIGFSIVGIEYAIMLGILTGLLNLIPYLGVMIALIISVLVSIAGTSDLSIIVAVVAVNLIVQLIDNNLLGPMIVNSKVKINAIFSIVGIIIGGMLAGIAGMFLAIPILAVIKVVFDRVESLEPWGYLIGDDLPDKFEWSDAISSNVDENSSSTDELN